MGFSTGNWEGNTLIVDTIGFNDKFWFDFRGHPHSEKLHVVERWRIVDPGKTMEATFTVEDPDAFYEPWSAMRRFRRATQQFGEDICAENNQHLFDYKIPIASKADF